jgi:hypothetical protein
MSGAIPLLPMYAFMTWKVTTWTWGLELVHLVNLSVRPEQAACGDISHLEWDGIDGEDWRIEYGLNPLWRTYPDFGVGNGWCTYRTCNQDTLSCGGYRFLCSGSFNPLASPTLKGFACVLEVLKWAEELVLTRRTFLLLLYENIFGGWSACLQKA